MSELLPGASAFLEAIPSKEHNLAWEPTEFATEVRSHLLANVFPEESWCPACDAVLDCKGLHCGVCAANGDRTRRHHGARNAVGRFAAAAGFHPELEKPGLLPPSPDQPNADRRRPADVYLASWQNGSPAALDLAISSPHRQDAPPEATSVPGAAAQAYEGRKRVHLNTAQDCATQGLAFVPIVGEPSGGWGPSAMCTFKAFARAQSVVTGQDAAQILAAELQRLCTVVRRANARAVLSRGCDLRALPGSAAGDAFALLGGE